MIPDYWMGFLLGGCIGILVCNYSWSQECKEMNASWYRVAKGLLKQAQAGGESGNDKGGWNGN